MCGIFCLFLNRPLADTDLSTGRAGTSALAHRGPDGTGEWIDKDAGVFLGHRRLAIVDLTSASDQPMVADGMALSYNGEIYNFREVRDRLKTQGAKFKTSGDVEVLLRAWQFWGEDSLKWLDGMFAFAVWEGSKASIVTDPFGEKPLYYSATSDGIYVSSEIAPLANLLGLEPSLEGETLVAYLALGFVPPPATAYPTIKRLGAAKVLAVERGKIVGSKTYWTPPVAAPGSGPARPLKESDLDVLHEILATSLKGRLHADAPLCMFLSRGIDSSLVAAMAKRDHDADLNCLTVSYPNELSENEAPGAAAIAAHLGLAHEVIPVAWDSAEIDPQEVVTIYGQPNESSTALSVKIMSTAASAKFKTGLTGSGGDEVFFGYGKNSFFYEKRGLYGIPQPFRRVLGGLTRPFASKNPRIKRLAFDILVSNAEQYLANKNFPTITWLRKLDGFRSWAEKTFPGHDPLEYAYRKFEYDTVLTGDRLVTIDHGSMAASMELRTPFLSRSLVEAVAEFDPRAFVAFGQKSVLRRLLARYLPTNLFDFPKSGFTFPQAKIVEGFGSHLPKIPGVADEMLAEAFRERGNGTGWERLVIRLISLDTFLQNATRPNVTDSIGDR